MRKIIYLILMILSLSITTSANMSANTPAINIAEIIKGFKNAIKGIKEATTGATVTTGAKAATVTTGAKAATGTTGAKAATGTTGAIVTTGTTGAIVTTGTTGAIGVYNQPILHNEKLHSVGTINTWGKGQKNTNNVHVSGFPHEEDQTWNGNGNRSSYEQTYESYSYSGSFSELRRIIIQFLKEFVKEQFSASNLIDGIINTNKFREEYSISLYQKNVNEVDTLFFSESYMVYSDLINLDPIGHNSEFYFILIPTKLCKSLRFENMEDHEMKLFSPENDVIDELKNALPGIIIILREDSEKDSVVPNDKNYFQIPEFQ